MGDEVRWFYLQLAEGQAGPWTAEEVVAAVEAGRAVATTPFWEEGMEAWEPLVKLIPELGAPDETPEGGQPAPGPVVVAAMSPNPSDIVPTSVAGGAVPPDPVAPTAFEEAPPPEPGSARMIALQMRMDARRKLAGATWLTLAWAFALVGAGLALFYFKPPFFWAAAGCMAAAAVAAFVPFFYGRPLGAVFALLAAVGLPFGTFTYVKSNDLRPFGLGGGGGEAAAKVVLSDESIRVQPGKVLYSAIVTNGLDQPVRDVVVTFELLDGDGNVVKTVREAVTGNGALPAGASARVEIEAEAGEDVANPRSRVSFKAG